MVQTRSAVQSLKLFTRIAANAVAQKRLICVRSFDQWQPSDGHSLSREQNASPLASKYSVVNLAGAPIADKRWSAARKRVLLASRVELTQALVAKIAESGHWPSVFISASAIGYYGTGERTCDESSAPGTGFAAELCRAWEAAAAPVASHTRLVTLRLGVVLGDGGALKKLLPMYRCGLGGPIAGGQQWFSWIYHDDLLNLIAACLEDPRYCGVYNATSPQPVRQQDFAKALATVLHVPSFLSTPGWGLRMLLGQMAEELLIRGQRVLPARLSAEQFAFQCPDLSSALDAALARQSS